MFSLKSLLIGIVLFAASVPKGARVYIYKKDVETIYPCLHKVSARNPPRTQVIAPRPIEYITRSYIQKMRETCHLLLFVKKISRFFMKIAINNRSQ